MKYDGTNLEAVLKAHRSYLANVKNEDGSRADFSGEVLEDLDFSMRELAGADFFGTTIKNCNFCDANLKFSDFSNASIGNSRFSRAQIYAANLTNSHFWCCQMDNVNLESACMRYARLRYGDFENAVISPTTDLCGLNVAHVKNMFYVPMACPEEGEFIAWKKCVAVDRDGTGLHKEVIVKLKIPKRARRSSALGRKCRASEAIVLAIQDLKGNDISRKVAAFSSYCNDFAYELGKTVIPREPFDDDRWNECSTGIHFFINRKEAVDYSL